MYSYTIQQINAKPEWALALFLSIIYFIIFGLIAQNVLPNKLLFGFCVWGDPDEPNAVDGCGDSSLNSHMGCFVIGMTAFMLEVVLYFMDKNRNESRDRKLTYLTLSFILVVHGLLHGFLQQTKIENILGVDIVINCYRNFDEYRLLVLIGMIVFGLWSFSLSMAILYLGLDRIDGPITIFSFMLTLAVLALTWDTGLELILPALFVTTHLLVCGIGLLSGTPSHIFASKTVGKCFIFATLAAIVELALCPEYKPLGGHIWYDIGLASVALSATPFFSFPSAKGKKD